MTSVHGKTNNAHIDGLLIRLCGGDKSAASELYSLTATPLYAYAMSVLKNAHDAQDVLHDLYAGLLGAPCYTSQGKPMAWLITAVRNLCYMQLRQRKKSADGEVEWESIPDGTGMAREDALTLEAGMKRLSDEERQIVTLHAVAGFKHREIAQTLDLPLPTVLSKYSRAIKKLKIYFEEGERQ